MCRTQPYTQSATTIKYCLAHDAKRALDYHDCDGDDDDHVEDEHDGGDALFVTASRSRPNTD